MLAARYQVLHSNKSAMEMSNLELSEEPMKQTTKASLSNMMALQILDLQLEHQKVACADKEG